LHFVRHHWQEKEKAVEAEEAKGEEEKRDEEDLILMSLSANLSRGCSLGELLQEDLPHAHSHETDSPDVANGRSWKYQDSLNISGDVDGGASPTHLVPPTHAH
jgi:hypothetical protein